MNNLYAPYKRGGAETVAELYYSGLNRLGHQVFVITTESYGKSAKKENVFYIKSFFPSLAKISVFLRLFWHLWDFFDFISAYQIIKILKSERAEMVITHNIKGLGFFTLLFLKRLHIRHVHVLHDIQLLHPSGLMNFGEEVKINSFFAGIYQSISSLFFCSTELVISPSSWLLSAHQQKGFFKKSRTMVLNNPFDDLSIVKTSELVKDDDVFTFLFIGQLESHKGIFLLLEAFSQINLSNVTLRIIGDGTEFEKLRSMGVDNVSFLGRMDKTGIAQEIKKADCLVVPSICYENSPTVIREAYSLGLPVLGSDLGGIQEIIKGLGGVLFCSGDKTDLREKMLWCFDNRTELKKIGTAGAEKIHKEEESDYFSWIKG